MINIRKNSHCGGSLINSRFIVTAGHCVSICQYDAWAEGGGQCEYSDPSHVLVHLGRHDRTLDNEHQIKMRVSDIFMHPDYKIIPGEEVKQFDIALLKLETAVDFMNTLIRPVCLPEQDNQDYAGREATLTGWGFVNANMTIPTILQEIEGPVVTNLDCATGMFNCYGNDKNCKVSGVPDYMICTKFREGRFCAGDSGGPLVTTTPGGDGVTPGENYVQIGLVSFASGTCDQPRYGVYTRISRVMEWIKQTVGLGHTDCPKE